ncbi:N-acetyltransferase [Paenalkalicoccus suaedae]|uniref:N-acetyltransferase n=1 Tax=Paenalkalicoccus suaedae TaxID=2592382 RepID=A0A859FJD7_9BACI|nr:N-acetyltransferase [Paenalkalicoccus suaedae]QKS72825.1 N-acetyltransferase [Paenalkalicoccus suaedae]
MHQIVENLNKLGVHSIENNLQLLLEIKETDTKQVSQIDEQMSRLFARTRKNLSLECPKALLDELPITAGHMQATAERMHYTRSLTGSEFMDTFDFEVWDSDAESTTMFLSEVMERDTAATRAFIQVMKEELPSQAARMITVSLIDGEPAGIVLPHLEPGKDAEGRFFWIGLHPTFRGKNRGCALHHIGLHRLQHDFGATTYVGATELGNAPMRAIMKQNGCTEQKAVMVTLECVVCK